MAKSNNVVDPFDVSASDVKGQDMVTDQDLYKPSPENGRNGVYTSLIRFLPWWKDSKQSVVKKWTVFIEDPVSGKKRTVDCPSTVNERSILREMFFKLYKSNSVREKELADKFKRKRQCFSPVLIIKDENRPELEGKIMILRYGQKLLDKLQNEMEPLVGKPRKPFSPYDGRIFSLIVSKKGGYPNYDDSSFQDEKYPLVIDGEPIDPDTTDTQDIMNYLKENTPDLEKYLYKPWDQQTDEFVREAIRNTVTNGNLIGEVLGGSKTSAPKTANKAAQIVDEDLDYSPAKGASKSSTKASNVSASNINIEEDVVSAVDDDDVDLDIDPDLYSGLGDE